MDAMARRGFRKFGGDFNPGDWGGFGGNFRIGRMLASGDLRLVALYLIEQQPRHGYDLIKAIEEHSHGFYSPSPGIVYPALTYLEEAGYVTSAAEGNKKLYTITEEGRALQKRMWVVYGTAINRFIGCKFSEEEARHLAALLLRLMQE